MAEALKVPNSTNRIEIYQALLPQIESLAKGETDLTANLANTAAALKEAFGFFWVGFYFVKGNELVLGPFQGPVACTRIARGKGVCGAAWESARAVIVPDVNLFPGHIACNSASISEIVVPVIKNGTVTMVLDVDSDKLNDFGEEDEKYLVELCEMISSW